MPIEAIIILVVTLAAFLAIGLWLGITATRAILPDGVDVKGTHTGPLGTVTVIVRRPSGAVVDQASRWAKHVYASAVSWGESGRAGSLSDALRVCSTIRVLLLDDKAFDAWDREGIYIDSTVAFQTYTMQRIGSGPPLLVIRDRLSAESKDSLVLHETIHALASANALTVEDNHKHKDARVWGGGDSIEARARIYVEDLL